MSWLDAREFCRRLSDITGERFELPTEAQWEYAARAAAEPPVSILPNLADAAFLAPLAGQPLITGGVEHLWVDGEGAAPASHDDGHVVTAPVGVSGTDRLGLADMIGNAAEWTLSRYAPYPWIDEDGRNDPAALGPRVVRSGSFFDPPRRVSAAARWAYPEWRRVFNVGFRIVAPIVAREVAEAGRP